MAGLIYNRGAKCISQELKKISQTSFVKLIRCFSVQNNEPSFGLLFDIDGVIVRGKKVIPKVPEAFRKLIDSNGEFRIPTVFLTNAGNGLTKDKASQLSDWLNIKVKEDHVVMAHTPLKVFHEFHNKNILVSGQGPIEEIARRIGFKKIVTIEDIRKSFPLLDAVDHKRRVSQMNAVSDRADWLPIEAVVLLGEPVRWETVLQLMIDVLMTDGDPSHLPEHHSYPHLPVLACNMDLQWMAEANMPRFGHGAFLLCLESLYKKITGKELIYTALVGKPSEVTYRYTHQVILNQANKLNIGNKIKRLYAIGDNINTDISGANLYNEYLSTGVSRMGADGHITQTNLGVKDCHSVLVKTGVYSHELSDSELDHAQRDFLNLHNNYRRPSYTVQDVCQAIDMIFKLEGFQ